MPLAAKEGDKVVGVCTHVVQVPAPPGPPVPTPIPGHPFSGDLSDGLSDDVLIDGKKAAVKGSKAKNSPAHVAIGGPAFQPPNPKDEATVSMGSSTVEINGKPAARMGDQAETCCMAKAPGNVVVSGGTVEIG
jgi:uncharacterized Zn-binding protein involved in type VI secretion